MDLIDTYSYIKYNLQEPAIAKKMIAKIREEINKLKDNPTIYAVIKDEFIKKREIRKIRVFIFFAVYNEKCL